jgi:hypothetical protein
MPARRKAASESEPKPTQASAASGATRARARKTLKTADSGKKRQIRCYICGREFEVSLKTLSTTCPGCNKAIKVEDVTVKSYVGLVALQTCGSITITKRGRVAAATIQAGGQVSCEGNVEGSVETQRVHLGPKSTWKGGNLRCRTLSVDDGAKLDGEVSVPSE